ncbi:hypothetical protein DPMN_009646 [Dreissena polymorpha]|uniref:Uncharacterized protein n=1 Tax=Dreissena polymorpha TaxID=45954 RepID=A0A9D4N005_DREPO|nr:hypothetical protein DPMN_009646 [Dreissena polymorpha]
MSKTIYPLFYEGGHYNSRSLEDAAPTESFTEDGPVAYETIMGGSQRGKDLLSDSIGHTFTVKEQKKKLFGWVAYETKQLNVQHVSDKPMTDSSKAK